MTGDRPNSSDGDSPDGQLPTTRDRQEFGSEAIDSAAPDAPSSQVSIVVGSEIVAKPAPAGGESVGDEGDENTMLDAPESLDRDDPEALVRVIQAAGPGATRVDPSEVPTPAAPVLRRALPDAQVGVPYSHEVVFGNWDSLTALPSPQSLGLRVDLDNGLVLGVPDAPGQYTVDIIGRRDHLEAIVTLTVDVFGQKIVAPEPQAKTLRLPNAQVGISYSESLALDGYSGLEFIDPDGLPGLVVDIVKSTISGEPQADGQFSTRLAGHQGNIPVTLTLIIDVIPDPKTLWKNNPSDPNAPFWKREESSEVQRWEVLLAAASKRGRSHAHEGSFRDDDYALARTRPGGWYVACVADGAGSSKYSRRASQLVTSQIALRLGPALESTPALGDEQITLALEAMASAPEDAIAAIKSWAYKPMLGEAIAAAEALREERKLIGCEQADLYTTILFAAAKKHGDRYLVISFGLGDGGMAIWNPELGTVTSLFTPEGGEFAGQTRFLRLDEFQDQNVNTGRLGVGILSAGDYAVLMTDGITDAMFPAEIDIENPTLWHAFWDNEIGQVLDFTKPDSELNTDLLGWLDFWSKSNHDDRTIAVMHNPRV